jgi:hypothetical protein
MCAQFVCICATGGPSYVYICCARNCELGPGLLLQCSLLQILLHTTHTTGDTQVESGRSLFAFLWRAIVFDPSDVMQKMTVRWHGECSHRHITHTLREWITSNGGLARATAAYSF